MEGEGDEHGHLGGQLEARADFLEELFASALAENASRYLRAYLVIIDRVKLTSSK